MTREEQNIQQKLQAIVFDDPERSCFRIADCIKTLLQTEPQLDFTTVLWSILQICKSGRTLEEALQILDMPPVESRAKKYVIAWASKKTSAKGEGTANFTYKEAQRICKEANIKFPQLRHYAKSIG